MALRDYNCLILGVLASFVKGGGVVSLSFLPYYLEICLRITRCYIVSIYIVIWPNRVTNLYCLCQFFKTRLIQSDAKGGGITFFH